MFKNLIFMISLMLFFISCANDAHKEIFHGEEKLEYNKYMEDFEAPKYKWGYIDTLGNLKVNDLYDDLREYKNGYAAVMYQGLWGFIDKKGNSIITPRYQSVESFSEGIGICKDFNGKYHLILSSGNIVVDSLDYDRINKFSSGLSLVNKGDLYGYINKSGKIAIDMQYQSAKSFIEKWAIVTKDQKSGIIDTDGKEVIPIIYEKIWLPESNKIRVKLNKKYYYLNLDGSKSNIKGYNKATNFFGNYAIVNNGAQYMLLDKNGKETVLPYKSVSVGGERKWIYSDGNKFGFLNNNGSQLTPLSFDLLMQYKEGRAGFAIDDIWGYLDEEGNIIIAPQYPLAWDFKNNYASIITKTGFGFIKKDGTLILPPKYMELRDFSNGLARIQVYR